MTETTLRKKILIHIHRQFVVVLIAALIYGLIFSYFSIRRHDAFFSGYDLSNMDQTVWNTLQGRFFELTRFNGTYSRFSIHADIILIFLAPFYALWNNVRMLLIIQSFAIAAGAIPTYLLTCKIFNNKTIGIMMSFIYLLNPTMHWVNMYDFHAISLAIPLLIATFYSIHVRKWHLYFIFMVLAIITKEQVSLVISLLGIVIATVYKQKKIGIFTFIFGIIWFFGIVSFVIPHFRSYRVDNQHWALQWYYFDNEVGEIGGIPIPSVDTVLHRFFIAPDALGYYKNLFKPFAFLPLFGFPWLFLALPHFAVNMLSTHAQMRGTMLHYTATIIPFLVISSIFGLKYLNIILQKVPIIYRFRQFLPELIMLPVLILSVRVWYRNTPLPVNKYCWCQMYDVGMAEKKFELILAGIPSALSITASPEIRPHITHRQNAYTIPTATDSANYIAIIDQNRLTGDTRPKDFENELIKQLSNDRQYTLDFHEGHFYLFRKQK